MKTFLAQNKFNSDSADAAECEAVAHASPPSTATANLIHQSSACEGNGSNAGGSKTADGSTRYFSDGVGAKPILASSPSEAVTEPGREPVAADRINASAIVHNPVTQAVEIRTGPNVSCGPKLPAAAPTAQAAAGSFEMHPDEDEVLYLLLKLHDKPGTRDLPDIPDERAFLSDVESPFLHFLLSKMSAPRSRAGDPVWADASPLFLQTAR